MATRRDLASQLYASFAALGVVLAAELIDLISGRKAGARQRIAGI
jgi:hypothetical protein